MSDFTVRSNCNITKNQFWIFKLPLAIIMDEANYSIKVLTPNFVRAT